MKKMRILIVDDLPQIREGLRLAERLQPDLVITDLDVLEQDGITTAHQLKQQGFAEAVIILTVHASETLKELADYAGVDAYVEKSAGIDYLIDKIRELAPKP